VSIAESEIIANSNAIVLKASLTQLDSTNQRLSTAEASIITNADNIALRVEKNGVVGAINLSAEALKINVAKIEITGDLVVTNGLVKLKDLIVDKVHIKDGAIIERMISSTVIANVVNAGTALIDYAKIGNVQILNAQIVNLDASKITTGIINAQRIQIGSGTTFAPGFDPTTKTTSTDVANQILTDKTLKDTRNDNQLPSWYFTNYPTQSVHEFKLRSVIGAPGSTTYGTLITKVPWSGTSGGTVDQEFSSIDGFFRRSGNAGATAWGAWVQVESTAGAQSKATTAEGNAKTHANTVSATAESNAKTYADLNDKVLNSGGYKTFFNPTAIQLSSNTAPSTLIIRTPITFGAYMCQLSLSGYAYSSGNETIEATVGFYAYNTSSWFTNTGFSTKGKAQVEYVQLASDASNKAVIIVKFKGTTIPYPKINVDKMIVGHTTPPDSWKDGWSASFSTDLTGLTVRNTPAGKNYDASHDLTLLWQYTDTTYIDGGNIYANTVTANEINVANLASLSANLGNVTAGNITGATMNVGAGQLVVTAGGVTFGGALNAATGTFKGALSAATGTFSGTLSGVDGRFDGSVYVGDYSANGNVAIDVDPVGGTYIRVNGKPSGGIDTFVTLQGGTVKMKNMVVSTGLLYESGFTQNGAVLTLSQDKYLTSTSMTFNIEHDSVTMNALNAGRTVVNDNDDALVLAYPAGDNAFISYDEAGVRQAFVGFPGNASNAFTVDNKRTSGSTVLSGIGYLFKFYSAPDGWAAIQGDGYGIIKFLSTNRIQFRDAPDTAYSTIYSAGHTAVSQRELKKNIVPYEEDALNEILTTPIRSYHFNDDKDWEQKRVGVIVDEAPLSAIDLTGAGVSEYSMVAMAWKAIQQLNTKINALEAKLAQAGSAS
jgi:hypothetical protein